MYSVKHLCHEYYICKIMKCLENDLSDLLVQYSISIVALVRMNTFFHLDGIDKHTT